MWSKLLLVFVLLLGMNGPLQARLLDDVVESGVLVVALYTDFPPFSYLKDGQPAGSDVAIARELARRLGVEPQWHWHEAGENVDADLRAAVGKGNALRSWKVADVMLRVPYDQELGMRNELVVLTAPYEAETFLLAHDTRVIEKFESYAVFMYDKVGVELDSIPDFILSGMFNGRLNRGIVRYPRLSEASEALLNGEVAAVMGLAGAVDSMLSGRSNIAILQPPLAGLLAPQRVIRCPDVKKDWTSSVEIEAECTSELAEPRTSWDIGMAVRQDSRDLGYALEDVITQMMEDGSLEAIYQEHGMTYRLPAFLQP
ncbi:MAG: substrate-binding periplasmic protein [bacterium]|jgi:polar amino acid transport system substrate-binding protein